MRRYSHIIITVFFLLALTGLTACKRYLDRAPAADVSPTDAYINFTNFQGFTEELYSLIPEYTSKTWACDWILGDACLRRALALQMQSAAETTLAPHQAMTRYPELAARMVAEPSPGGWLGGEQPKFLATLEESGVERRQVLVKF